MEKVKLTELQALPLGADIGNPPEGFANPKDMGEDDKYGAGGTFTVLEIFQDFQGVLESAGVRMVPALSGLWAGFHLYCEDQLDFPGLTTPNNFRYLRKLEPSNSDDLAKVSGALDANRPQSQGKYYNTLWYGFVEALTVRQQNKQTRLYEIASGRFSSGYGLKVSLTGRSGAHKVIPPHSWFPDNVKAVTPEKLLALFPPAERKAMMLALGRVMVGSTNEATAEGKLVEHTWRSMMLAVGYDAGLGKSWLMGTVIKAIRVLGYEVIGLSQDLGQFGFAKPAMADLVFVDDMVQKTQTAFMQSAEIKSMISNGEMSANEKYIPISQVKTRSTIVACTNHFNYLDYLKTDSGMIDRINALSTLRKDKLDWKGVDMKPMTYWNVTAKALGVTVELLAAWLCRLSVDYFQEVIGYDSEWNQVKPARLEAELDELRKDYEIDVDLTHVKDLVKAVVRTMALALASVEYEDYDNNYRIAKELPLSWQMVWEYVKFGAKWDKWDAAGLKPIRCDTIDWVGISDAISHKAAEVTLRTRTQSTADIFKWVTSELKSTKGFGFPTSIAFYSHLYDMEMKSLDTLVIKFRYLIEQKGVSYKHGSSFKEMLGNYHQILARAAQLNVGREIVEEGEDYNF